jgi:5-methylcytosine-specific restriction enzyme subunit McrC
MRTIRLTEHRAQTEILSAEEYREISALPANLLEVSPSRNGLVKLKPSCHVGTVVLASVRLLIRPKAGLRNVFFLLAYSRNIRWRPDDFPYEEDDLFKAIAWWFDRECAAAARLGLTREYVEREEPQSTLRGRLLLGRQLATRPGRRVPIECRFQEYSEDTSLNRTIKAAHHTLLRAPALDHAVATRLRHRARQTLGGVSSVEHPARMLPPLVVSRLNRHWESAFHLAEMILRQRSIRDEHGRTLGTSFTVDMNKLFERFVQLMVAERVRETTFSLKAQTQFDLTSPAELDGEILAPPVRIRPDLVLKLDRSEVAVGDAKYKQVSGPGDWRNPDIYQLLAYCARLGLKRGLLIYAGAQPLVESQVLESDIVLASIGIDLSGSPKSVLQQGQRAADALIAQAGISAHSGARHQSSRP